MGENPPLLLNWIFITRFLPLFLLEGCGTPATALRCNGRAANRWSSERRSIKLRHDNAIASSIARLVGCAWKKSYEKFDRCSPAGRHASVLCLPGVECRLADPVISENSN